MESPLFSVILPTYGRGELLEKAVDSVIAQTVTSWECIIVDDCGPCPVKSYGDSRVRIVRLERNGGPARARNAGLRQVRGRFVAFLDDDDLFTPNRLELALEGLSRAPIAICWAQFLGTRTRGGRSFEGMVADRILDSTTPPLGATALRSEHARPFDERFDALQDVEWWLRMAQRNSVTTVERVGYLVRQHSGPRHRNGKENRVYYSRKLLEVHKDYFADHPQAAAFRWKRIGLIASRCGDYRMARHAFMRSFRLHPQASNAWHWTRSLKRSGRSKLRSSELDARP